MHIENNLLLQWNKIHTWDRSWTTLNMHATTTTFQEDEVFINTGLANLNSEKELSFYKKKNSYSQNERLSIDRRIIEYPSI